MGKAEKHCVENRNDRTAQIERLISDIRSLAVARGWTERTTCVKVFNNSRLIESLQNQSGAIAANRRKLDEFIAENKPGKARARAPSE